MFHADPRPGGSTVLAAIYDPETGFGGATAVSTDDTSNSANFDELPHVVIDGGGQALVSWRRTRTTAVSFVSRLHDPATCWGDMGSAVETRSASSHG